MYVTVVLSFLLLWGGIEGHDITISNLRDGFKDMNVADLFAFNVGTFLKGYGYPFENHEVVTEDGYVLGLHRIPHGRSNAHITESEGKPAVLFMHGIGSNSVDYLILGPEKSLPLKLADAGYDVWLGNNRGNTWSRKHLTLNPDENSTFWNFSFHELGIYDLPVLIDHVLNVTGHDSISYVGHSQGTTEFFVTMSMKPEYNEKINSMVALAPVAYVANVKNELFQFLKNFIELVDITTNALNVTEFLPHSSLLSMALSLICSDRSPFQQVCSAVYFFLGGESDQFNKTTLSIIVQSYPGGSAMKEWKHFLQEIKSEHFRQYDYGLLTNLVVYGQTEPPSYDLSKVSTPVTLFSGGKDTLATAPDVDRLAEALPNVASTHVIDYYSHNDFLFAMDASTLYEDIIKLLDSLRQ